MAYSVTELAAFYESDGSSSHFVRPGCVSEPRRKSDENFDVTIMESGRAVATRKSESRALTVEITFKDLQYSDESDGSNLLRGFGTLLTFFQDTIGPYGQLRYKRAGVSPISYATYRLHQADLVYAETREGIYTFKIVLRRII